MGFLDYLFGRREPQIRDAGQLQQALFEAAQAGDVRRLERLCRANRSAIAEHFPGWQKVPEGLRDDPQGLPRYIGCLVAVAQTFADRLGSPELLQRLTGSPQDNPLVRWQEGLRRSQALMADLRYREAQELLSDLLIDARGLRGSGVDTYLPVTLGQLGECYFQARQAEKALAPWEQALELCVRQADAAGVAAYLGNLYEAHRYLGQAAPAAACAVRLADALGQQGRAEEARRYRRQAEIVRAGELRNRVVAVVEGRRYELDEVAPLDNQRVQFVFERNRTTLRPATAATERGEQQGSAGRYEEALEAFRAAAQADPFDPHARYQEGLTLLHLRRYAEAVEAYEAAEELAPGWFHCRADLWLARQLALGNLSQETFLALHVLEDAELPPEEKVKLAAQALSRTPRLAPLHLLHGKSLSRLGRPDEAQAAYRQGLACEPEPDTKTRLLVELGVLVADAAERVRLLREAQALGGNLVAAATATLALRAFASAGS
jgi:tetratricopeptide (TPR) repeat protein